MLQSTYPTLPTGDQSTPTYLTFGSLPNGPIHTISQTHGSSKATNPFYLVNLSNIYFLGKHVKSTSPINLWLIIRCVHSNQSQSVEPTHNYPTVANPLHLHLSNVLLSPVRPTQSTYRTHSRRIVRLRPTQMAIHLPAQPIPLLALRQRTNPFHLSNLLAHHHMRPLQSPCF